MHERHKLCAKDNQLGMIMAMLEINEVKLDKPITAGHEKMNIQDKLIANRNEEVIEIIAKLKASNGGKSGSSGGKKAFPKYNDHKAKRARVEKDQNKDKKKIKLRK